MIWNGASCPRVQPSLLRRKHRASKSGELGESGGALIGRITRVLASMPSVLPALTGFSEALWAQEFAIPNYNSVLGGKLISSEV